MSDINFEDDPASRNAMRFLLLLQIAELLSVIGLLSFQYYAFALILFLLTIFVSIAIVFWLYIRYRKIPIVQEKRNLDQRVLSILNDIRTQDKTIRSAGENENDLDGKRSQDVLQRLENELKPSLLRLDQLELITFVTYLSKSLIARRSMSTLAVLSFLAISQVVSGVYVSTSAIVAFLPTATATPTMTSTPTSMLTPTSTFTSTPTPSPTYTLIPTNTPLVIFISTPTRVATLVVLIPTRPVQAVCSCSGNTLDCSDFSSHASAQACYNYCISIGAGDVHHLDGNNDGGACESLP